jgi:sialate O-acetylesterase
MKINDHLRCAGFFALALVSSSSVPHPKEVRYAWQANPKATLFNGAGLPATPFRTDDWPGIVQIIQ